MRRYVRDAGPLLDRLHMLVRADCTTRNKRKAAARRAAVRRARGAHRGSSPSRRSLDRIRPDLDGNEIMALLGLPPGPLVGEAYQFLLELRLDAARSARRGGRRAARLGRGGGPG